MISQAGDARAARAEAKYVEPIPSESLLLPAIPLGTAENSKIFFNNLLQFAIPLGTAENSKIFFNNLLQFALPCGNGNQVETFPKGKVSLISPAKGTTDAPKNAIPTKTSS